MTVMAPTPQSSAADSDHGVLRSCTAGWREYLVELLVLTENGDGTAARRLSSWLAIDPIARSVSSRIAHDVRALRS